MKFDRDELFKHDLTSLENKDDMIFKRSIVLCGIFENRMRTFGWRVGELEIHMTLKKIYVTLLDNC